MSIICDSDGSKLACIVMVIVYSHLSVVSFSGRVGATLALCRWTHSTTASRA